MFSLRTSKNLRKINVFGPHKPHGAPHLLPPPFRREGTAHRQNLYTQSPDSPHLCGRLVKQRLGQVGNYILARTAARGISQIVKRG